VRGPRAGRSRGGDFKRDFKPRRGEIHRCGVHVAWDHAGAGPSCRPPSGNIPGSPPPTSRQVTIATRLNRSTIPIGCPCAARRTASSLWWGAVGDVIQCIFRRLPLSPRSPVLCRRFMPHRMPSPPSVRPADRAAYAGRHDTMPWGRNLYQHTTKADRGRCNTCRSWARKA
jgi:hypothetical protein